MSNKTKLDFKQLRAIGHKLKPVVTIAGKGLSENVLVEIDRALADHEFIKIKLAVGGRNERTNLEVVETICDILDELRPRKEGSYKDLITFVADRPGHDARYAIDATKLETDLGWNAQEDFDTGIRKTIQWYLDNEWWWGPLRAARYAGERLGRA